MGRTASLVTLALLLFACGGRYSDGGTGGAGGSSANGAGGSSANAAGPTAGGIGGGSGTDGGASGGNANAAGAPHPPRLGRCEDSYYSCCNRDDGHVDASTCGTDGRWLPCAGNSFHSTGEACMPDSVSVADCEELSGLACEPGNECHNFGKCTTYCTCEVMGGGYLWACLALAC